MEILIYACANWDQRFRTNRGLNQHLRSCYLKNKISNVQTRMKEMKAMQKTKHLMIQILRFLIFQLHHCDINGSIIKIICLREIYLSLMKNSILDKKIYFLSSGQVGKKFMDEIFRLMNGGCTSRH